MTVRLEAQRIPVVGVSDADSPPLQLVRTPREWGAAWQTTRTDRSNVVAYENEPMSAEPCDV